MAKEEADIQKEVYVYLIHAGYFCWRNHTQGVRMKGRMVKNPNAGGPDLMAVKDGQFYAIEIKTKAGKLSDVQKQWLTNARNSGAVTLVVTSVESLIQMLQDIRDPAKSAFTSDMVKSPLKQNVI